MDHPVSVARSSAHASRLRGRQSRSLRLLALSAAWLIALAAYALNILAGFGVAAAVLAVAFGFGYAQDDSPAHRPVTSISTPQAALSALLQARSFWIGALAVAVSMAAAVAGQADPQNAAAGFLWLASLLLIVSAALRHDPPNPVSWRQQMRALRQPAAAAELALLALVTLVALALRAYDLHDFPPVMHGDEGEMGVIALDILSGKLPPLFAASPFFSLPYLFNYLQALSLLLFGADEGGLRMLSALIGTACVPLLYGLARAGWGRVAAFVAAWLLMVSHLAIHYSRLGFIFIESVAAMLALMWLYARIHQRKAGDRSVALFVAAGLTLGLAQYFYYASRVMPLISVPILLYLWRVRKASLTQIAALLIAAFVAFSPLGLYFLNHLDVFLDRVGFVSIFRPENVQHTLGPGASLPADLFILLKVQTDRVPIDKTIPNRFSIT